MRIIEVYYNNNYGLMAIDSSIFKNGRKFINNRIYNDNVQLMLSTFVDRKIKGRKFSSDGCEYIYYDDLCIKINNVDFIRTYGLLDDYLKKVDEQVREYKNRYSNKVKRKNKYIKEKIIAGGLALSMLLTAGIWMGKDKKDDINKDAISTEQTLVIGKSSFDIKNKYLYKTIFDGEEIKKDDSVITDEETEKIQDYIYIDYDDRSDYQKLKTTKELYGDLIEKYAKMYGLDYNLVLAVATQERGVHSSKMDKGGATGLMQIQNSVWTDYSISVYNFEMGQKETFKITKAGIEDCETNIKIGCMILQECMKQNKYNILLGLQSYNMGTRGAGKAVTACATEYGCSREDIINNPSDCGWLNYREGIAGDPLYVEHVLSYIGSDILLSICREDGSVVECVVKNYENVKTR